MASALRQNDIEFKLESKRKEVNSMDTTTQKKEIIEEPEKTYTERAVDGKKDDETSRAWEAFITKTVVYF
jgi:hypothetical protein